MNSDSNLITLFCYVHLLPTTKLGTVVALLKMMKIFFILSPKQDQINDFLKLMSYVFEGTNTLIILDDCAVSKDVKQKTSELVELSFSGRHKGISLWVITQQMTSITNHSEKM